MMSCDICRSRSLSASTTSAGESCSPHGVRAPKESFTQPAWSVTPLLATSRPSVPYSQCRGNPLAPVSSTALVPSARSVSAIVVHTTGEAHCTSWRCGTGRGSGAPVRPPTVCTSRTSDVPIPSGSRCTVGSRPARKVAPSGPTCSRVTPIRRPEPSPYPAAVTTPSATSARPCSTLPNRNRSSSRIRSTSPGASRSGGTGS